MAKRISTMLIAILMLFAIMGSSIQAFAEDSAGINSITIEYGLGKEGVIQKDASGNDKTYTYKNGNALEGVGTKILSQYKTVIAGVSGVLALTFVLLLLLNLAKLGKSGGNPQMRSQAIGAIIWTGIAAACTGGIGLFFGFFYDIGKDL